MIPASSAAVRTPQRMLLLCGFGGLLFIGVFVVLGALAPGYSQLHDTISAIEFTPLGAAQRANFALFGALMCGFAVAMRNELSPGRGSAVIPLFQTLGGLGVIGDAIFIYEPLHMVCDLVAFNSALLVLILFAWRFKREEQWRGWSAYSIGTALLMMLLLSAFGFMNHVGGPAGAMEKLASAIRTAWSAALAARLLGGARLGITRRRT